MTLDYRNWIELSDGSYVNMNFVARVIKAETGGGLVLLLLSGGAFARRPIHNNDTAKVLNWLKARTLTEE